MRATFTPCTVAKLKISVDQLKSLKYILFVSDTGWLKSPIVNYVGTSVDDLFVLSIRSADRC